MIRYRRRSPIPSPNACASLLMVEWDFNGCPRDDAWTRQCLQADTARVLRRSRQTFPLLGQRFLDPVKHRVADVRSYGVRTHGSKRH